MHGFSALHIQARTCMYYRIMLSCPSVTLGYCVDTAKRVLKLTITASRISVQLWSFNLAVVKIGIQLQLTITFQLTIIKMKTEKRKLNGNCNEITSKIILNR